jgi:hypothetical protein
MGKIGLAATILLSSLTILLVVLGVQGVTMPQPLFITIAVIMSIIAIIAIGFLSRAGIKAIRNTEWQKRRIYRIQGVPKTIPLGENQIQVFLKLGATRYVGSPSVSLVKERGAGVVVLNNVGWVSFNSGKTNFKQKIRRKGEKVSIFLDFHANTQWKGWLKIGFHTEAGEIPYIHFPIAFQ